MIKLITLTVLLVLGLTASNHSFLKEKSTINEEVGLGDDNHDCAVEFVTCEANCAEKCDWVDFRCKIQCRNQCEDEYFECDGVDETFL